MTKIGIVIGRFAPLHLGHQALIDAAVAASDRVVVLVGSAFDYPNARTPFTFPERVKMLKEHNEELFIQPLRDFKVGEDADTRWETEVFARIGDALRITCEEDAEQYEFTLFGNTKDDTDYLNWFPEWNYIEAGSEYEVSATDIREELYNDLMLNARLINSDVNEFLQTWKLSDTFTRIANQYHAHIEYNDAWSCTPYPVNFVAGDACVIGIDQETVGVNEGTDEYPSIIDDDISTPKILLIQRRCGAWAMAGGFLDKNETINTCIVRELKEETGLDVPVSAIVGVKVFDNPTRSQRGRIITHCGLIYLDGCDTVEGLDDAVDAKWFTLEEFHELYSQGLTYSDHYDIIEAVLATS